MALNPLNSSNLEQLALKGSNMMTARIQQLAMDGEHPQEVAKCEVLRFHSFAV